MKTPTELNALPLSGEEREYDGILVRNLGDAVSLFDLFVALRYEAQAAEPSSCETAGACKGGSVLLDSSLVNELGRFSIAGVGPFLVLEETEGHCFENGRPIAFAFEDRLTELLAERRADNPTDLPLLGGALGYFSYDFGRKFEAISSRHPRISKLPDARYAFYDNLLIEDHATGMVYATALGERVSARKSLDAIARVAQDARRVTPPTRGGKTAAFAPNFSRSDYEGAIARMIEYIVDGDIYIANMTQCLAVGTQSDPFSAYCYLRAHNPAPFSAFLDYPDGRVACASMERFCRVKSGTIETRPIKGTRPRGATPSEDEAMRQELIESEKDRSELLMIVDLERNDLNRICRPGSVKVTKHFAIEEYATVFHLVTTIRGELESGVGAAELIRSLFPGGSITGAPKIRAMEIIDELEHGRRGLYTGSIGYFGFDGDCDLNIVIRTAVFEDGSCRIGVGGGITCESDTGFEYEETLQKARALLEALAETETPTRRRRRDDSH